MAKNDDLVTKKYFSEEIRKVEKRLDGRIDSLAYDLREFRGEMDVFRQEMAGKYDSLVTIISYRVSDHEGRIQKLEKAQAVI